LTFLQRSKFLLTLLLIWIPINALYALFLFTRHLLVFGMMMKYFAPTVPAITSSIKRLGSLLLPLPFCIVLISCDSQSTTTSAAHNPTMKQSLTDSKVHNNQYDSAQMNDDSLAVADDVASEGESLIAAAKPDDNVQTRRAPMISDPSTGSGLEATLIGDYVGILPCSFCDSVSVTLNLFADGSVLKTSIYENPKTSKVPLAESGVYRQDSTMITIVYQDNSIESYTIQDNHLVMMSDDNTLNADFTLSRK